MIDAILDKIDEIRRLEFAASNNLGENRESEYAAIVYYHHIPSAAYKAYEKAWFELIELINGLPRPEGWIQLAEWCENSKILFGNITQDSPLEPYHWAREQLTVRTALLSSILRCTVSIKAQEDGKWICSQLTEYISGLAELENLPGKDRSLALKVRARFRSLLP